LLKDNDIHIHGFINPGHVSAIVGSRAYEYFSERYNMPQVISGFEPQDVLESLCILIEMILKKENGVVNQYRRVVSEHGNVDALKAIDKVFERTDGSWRGLGVVKNIGVRIKNALKKWDAEKEFKDVLNDFVPREDPKKRACKCGDVLKGLCTPKECSLFMKTCTPRDPVGPCMVSMEGACNIWATFEPE
jgi:hydrogenase expression/formation protein HypD